MNINILSLFLLFIQYCYCDHGIFYEYMGPYPTSFYECIANQGYKQMTLISSNNLISTTYIFAQWVKAKNAGLILDPFLRLCRKNNPLDYITQLMKYVPKDFDDTFWIYPDPFTDPKIPECSWNVNLFSPESNCDLLKVYVKLMKQRGLKIGILATDITWVYTFNKNGCPDFGSEKLLWSAGTSGQNFDDFVSFGGWTRPTIKVLGPKTTVCGVVISRQYF